MALAHLYAAMMADVSLDLIGSNDMLLIDGRFAAAPVFTQALANLRPATIVLSSNNADGVAQGALRLANVMQTGIDAIAPGSAAGGRHVGISRSLARGSGDVRCWKQNVIE